MKRAPKVFARLEEVALAHGARPHWGQWFSMKAVPKIAKRYGKRKKWKAERKKLDARGRFANVFSRKLLKS